MVASRIVSIRTAYIAQIAQLDSHFILVVDNELLIARCKE